jgi:hypothetical protein
LKCASTTLINEAGGSITGGAGSAGIYGGTYGGAGGAGGAGVYLNGGTLTTSGTISGGAGGSGATPGAGGDAVQFGTSASMLVVNPGAVFHGQVVANAAVNDTLELSGIQSGGTAITLGRKFTNFATLQFANAANWTVDATKAALTVPNHTLQIDGFAIGHTLDITNLSDKVITQSFNSTTDQLTLTHGATVITLDFNSSVSGDQFVLTAAGGGTDATLASGADATVASLCHDVTNFVSDYHRALIDDRSMPAHGVGSRLLPAASATASDHTGYGIASHASIDHGSAHAGPFHG